MTRALLVALFALGLLPWQETRALRFAWDLDPTHDRATFELEVDGVVQPCVDLTVTSAERQCTAVVVSAPHVFRLRGVRQDDDGLTVGAWSGTLSYGGPGAAPGLFTITARHVPPIGPDPPPVTQSSRLAGGFALSCCRLTAEATMTARVTAPAGSLLVAAIRLPDSHTTTVQGIQGAGTWTPVERPRGTGSVTVGFELWWAVATGGSHDLTITLSEPRQSWSWTVIPFAVAGTGPIQVASSAQFVKTVWDRQHPSAPEPGVSAQPGDVMVGGGTTFSTVGTQERAAEGWTIEESIGTRGITQYRLPTEPVVNDRAIWSADNPRLAVSAVVVFRRAPQ